MALISPLRAALRSEAYVGEPFGVGRVTVDVVRGERALPLSDERFTIVESDGRAMYPVVKEEKVRRLIRRFLKRESPRKVTIFYLFQGDQPLDLSAFTPVEQRIRVVPRRNPAGHRALMDDWWKETSGRLTRLQKESSYLPVAENFVAAMHSRRLGRPIPESTSGLLGRKPSKTFALSELFANEAHRLRTDREMILYGGSDAAKLLPLPAPIAWTPPAPTDSHLDEIALEPIAAHVPEECFYLRFGSFTNYLWFRDLNKKWQGDLGNMLLRRGVIRGTSQRLQQQLSLKDSALAKFLGPQIIADAALIGLDPYVGQGAAIGIVLQAKNNFLLSNDLMRQRRGALAQFDDAEEKTISIADQNVSLIATPDGRVRSYYVAEGDFHFVTTSRTLVKRFLEAGQGDRSLALLPNFREVRRQFPINRDDALFAYVPAEFFQNLCSPHYRIESRRRLRSAREPHLIELARLAAGVERTSAASVAQLVGADILPEKFATRFDGSVLLDTEEGSTDSLRGAPGYFLPIADATVDSASSDEIAVYQRFAKRFRTEVGQMPPVAVALHRTPRAGGGERLTADVLLSPIAGWKLGSEADMLGQPSDQQLRPVVGDLLSIEAVLDLPVPLVGGESQPHHLFGALRDYRSPLAVRQGKLAPAGAHTELVRGYVGAWPRPGLLEVVLGSARPIGNKPERVNDQLWHAQQEEFLLISFKHDVVEEVLPQLAMEPADRAAQIRVRLQDLTNTQLADTVSALGYMRSRETSASASRLMNSLANQLHVPRRECRAVAERLVEGQFVCVLGGEYQLYAPQGGLEVWASSALTEANRFLLAELPEDFRLPLLDWFRGFHGDLTLTDESLRVHLEIEMSAESLP